MIDALLRKAIESRIASAGFKWLKVLNFDLRTAEKTATIALQLEGEDAPLSISAQYRLEDNTIIVTSIAASKKWMTEALTYALLKHGGRFPLPGGISGTLAKMVL
ncbi:MAG: hypothetical protein ACR2OZ_14865 [Verrucomicrobiales bacterium]